MGHADDIDVFDVHLTKRAAQRSDFGLYRILDGELALADPLKRGANSQRRW